MLDWESAAQTRFVGSFSRRRRTGADALDRRDRINTWQEADLPSVGDRSVRLELTTEGLTAPAGLGDPEVMMPRADRKPSSMAFSSSLAGTLQTAPELRRQLEALGYFGGIK